MGGSDSAELLSLGVLPAHQRLGLARRLMKALVEAARARRYTRMIGMVLKENRRMLDFTRKLGFRTEPNADDHDLLDVILEL